MTQEEAIRRENRQLRAKEVKKMGRQKSFICIDLKSFYASVECVERGLDPFKTNLVVADPTRSQSTICLAITPAMKKLGVKNRCRIHEISAGIEYIILQPCRECSCTLIILPEYTVSISGIFPKRTFMYTALMNVLWM